MSWTAGLSCWLDADHECWVYGSPVLPGMHVVAGEERLTREAAQR